MGHHISRECGHGGMAIDLGERHDQQYRKRVIDTETLNLSAVTEPEIEALAKRRMIAVV